MAHRPDLAERVCRAGVGRGRGAGGAGKVDWAELGALLEELEGYVRPDWENVMLVKVGWRSRLFFLFVLSLTDYSTHTDGRSPLPEDYPEPSTR